MKENEDKANRYASTNSTRCMVKQFIWTTDSITKYFEGKKNKKKIKMATMNITNLVHYNEYLKLNER